MLTCNIHFTSNILTFRFSSDSCRPGFFLTEPLKELTTKTEYTGSGPPLFLVLDLYGYTVLLLVFFRVVFRRGSSVPWSFLRWFILSFESLLLKR